MFFFQDVLVTPAFKELQQSLEKDRILTVYFGNVVGEIFDFSSIKFDPFCEFRRNPMSLLIEYCKEAGYRLVDLFNDFDRDGNQVISKEEFIMGIKVRNAEFQVKRKGKIFCNNNLARYTYLITHFVLFEFQKAGVKISIRQLEILIESLDINKDGNIDFR